MDNKRLKQLILLLTVVSIVIAIFIVKREFVTGDEKRFKREFESFNGKTSLRFSQAYPKVKIEKQNGIQYASGDEVVDLLEKGTGVIFLAYPEGVRARILLPDFLETCYQENVKTIYYFNAYSSRDEKEMNEEKVITLRDGSKEYKKILERLGEQAKPYQEVNDGSKRVYFPSIIVVKNGEILYTYLATEEEESSFDALTEKSRKQFKKELKESLKKITKME